MDYTELLFAATVRDLAAGLKARAGEIYFKSLTPTDESRAEKRKQWDLENPTINFVPEALAQLKAVAAIVKENV